MPLAAPLDAGDDVNRFVGRRGRRRGSARGAGSRWCGLGCTPGGASLLGWSTRDGRLVRGLLEEMAELSHLLLQRDELRLQGVQRRGQGEQLRGPRGGNRRRG